MNDKPICKRCHDGIEPQMYYVKVGIFRISYYHGTCWEEHQFDKKCEKRGRVWFD